LAITDNSTGYQGASGRAGAALSAAMNTGTLALPVKIFLVMVAIPFAFALGPVVITGVRLVLIFLIPVMAVRLISGKAGKMLPVDVLFFLHWLWIGVTIGIHNPDSVIQNVGATGVEFLGGYFLGRTFIRTKEDYIGLIRFSVLLVVLSLPLAVFETLTGRSLLIEILNSVPGIKGAVKAYSEKRLGLNRVQMDFATPIHYGVYCTLIFSLCYFGLKGVYSRTKRLVATLVIFACVFFSLSSGALLPVMLQLFMIIWAFMFRKNTERRWWYLLGWLAFCYVTIDLLSNRTPYRVFMTYATFSPGTAYWRAAINQFGMDNVWEHPFIGIGFSYWKRPSWMQANSVDNFWLLMAMRHGIPGFLLVAAGYCMALWQIIFAKLGSGDEVLLRLRLAWVFTFFSLALTLNTVHIWSEIYSLVFFHIGAGLWMVTVGPASGGEAAAPVPLRAATISSRPPGAADAAPARAEPPPPQPRAKALPHTRSHAAIKADQRPAPDTGDGSEEQQRYTRFPPKSREADPK